ncbi:MAG: M28 family peptidase [Bacteroidales bacterium]
MKKTCILFGIIVFSLFSHSLRAQLKNKVDGDKIKSIISHIASDEFQGRQTATSGCVMTEEYFANEFKKLKLLPVGDNGSYFYNYSVPDYNENIQPTLTIEDRAFITGWDEEFWLAYNSDGGTAEAEIVFAGYGIYAPEKNRNDFENIDIKNKIVLIKRGAPLKNVEGWRAYCIDSIKAEYCSRNGALGILFYNTVDRFNAPKLTPYYNNYLAEKNVISNFPVFMVDERVARFILYKAPTPYYRMNRAIEKENVSFSTGKIAKMSAATTGKTPKPTRNVLAMLPGTDPKLKNEYIVIGGHIDHIGMDDAGNICNGADDNASGPSIALGIAQAMVKNKFKPKRSIVFVGWTGEEMGLLGSEAWCEKPTLDLSKIVVYFNLDMVGLGDGNLDMPGTEFAPEVSEFIKNNTDSTTLKRINWEPGGIGGSDHNGFLRKGVPAFAGMTSGSHPDYHQPGDDADKIKTDILQFTGDFIYHCIEKIATSNQNFISPERMEENKLNLINFILMKPILSDNMTETLKDRKVNHAFIDFSDKAQSSSKEENFITLLNSFEKTREELSQDDKYLLAPTAYESATASWRGKTGLMPAFNPDAIGLDNLMLKVIAKYGFRLAIINNQSSALADSSKLKSLINISSESGVGLLLDNLTSDNLEIILDKANKPFFVLCSDPQIFSDTIVAKLVDKKCLVGFQPSNQSNITKDLEYFEMLRTKFGDSNITLSPIGFTQQNDKYFKQFLSEFIKKYPNIYFQENIFDGNFNTIISKSLQED